MYCNMILIDIYYYTVLCCHTCIILYCTATNMYLNICIIVPNDPSGNRVASVIDITVFSLSVCFLQVVFFLFILQHNIRPPWLAQYNILCHKIILVFRVSKQLPCNKPGHYEELQVEIQIYQLFFPNPTNTKPSPNCL